MLLPYLLGLFCVAGFEAPESLRRLLATGEYRPQVPFQQSVHTTIQALKRYKPETVAEELDRIMLEISGEMEKFQRLGPLFQIIKSDSPNFSERDRVLASGRPSQEYHERYVGLENERLQNRAGDEVRLKPLFEKFLQDLRAHIEEVSEAIPRMARESGARIPPGLPLGGIYGQTLPKREKQQEHSNPTKFTQTTPGALGNGRTLQSGAGIGGIDNRVGVAPSGVFPSPPQPQAQGHHPGAMKDTPIGVPEPHSIPSHTVGGARAGFVGPPIGVPPGPGPTAAHPIQPPPPQAPFGAPLGLDAEVQQLFVRIEAQMAAFGKVGPLFQHLPSPSVIATMGFSAEEQEVLTGQPSQLLHERFLAIQDKQLSPELVPIIRQFVLDLEAHVAIAREVVSRAVSGTGGIGGVPAGGPHSGIPGRPVGAAHMNANAVPSGNAGGRMTGIPGRPVGVASGSGGTPGTPPGGRMTGIPGRPVGVASAGGAAPGDSAGRMTDIPGRPVGAAQGDASARVTGIPGRPVGHSSGAGAPRAGIPGRAVGPSGSAGGAPSGVSAGRMTGIPGRPVGLTSENSTGSSGGSSKCAGGDGECPVGTMAGFAASSASENAAGKTDLGTRIARIPGKPVGAAPTSGIPRTGPHSDIPKTANIGGIAGGAPPTPQQNRQAPPQSAPFASGSPPVAPVGASAGTSSPWARTAPGAASSGSGRTLDQSFEEIEGYMKTFETIKPKFARLPSPQQLKPHVSADDFQLLSGQASETLHHRFLTLQKRASSASEQPVVLARDADKYTTDLKEHIQEMERVLAVDYSAIAAGAVPTDAAADPSMLTREQILKDLPQVEKDLRSVRKRFKKTLKSTEKIMLKSEPNIAMVKKEMDRLTHMMGSLYSSVTSSVAVLRKELLTGPMTDKLRERLEAMLLEIRRYKDTVRDLEGESVKKDGAAPAAMDMLKLQGMLTSKPVDLSNAKMPSDKAQKASINVAAQAR